MWHASDPLVPVSLGVGWANPPGYAAYTAGPLGAALERIYQLVVLRFAWAVEVFIVLSGFSLMIPVARAPDGRLKDSYLGFMRRRARRILPPYYAALVFSLLLILVVPGMGQPSEEGRYWNQALPAFEPGVILSHLFLVHLIFGGAIRVYHVIKMFAALSEVTLVSYRTWRDNGEAEAHLEELWHKIQACPRRARSRTPGTVGAANAT